MFLHIVADVFWHFAFFLVLSKQVEKNVYRFAENAKRVNVSQKAVENEKFTMRTFLNRIGLSGDEHTKVYETERLIHFCERGEMSQEYNEDLFELFVDHIYVYSRQEVGFVLHCGLTFKERI